MTSRKRVQYADTKQVHSFFSGQYLCNRSTLDIGVWGYIGIVWSKENSPEVWSVPSVTLCIYPPNHAVQCSLLRHLVIPQVLKDLHLVSIKQKGTTTWRQRTKVLFVTGGMTARQKPKCVTALRKAICRLLGQNGVSLTSTSIKQNKINIIEPEAKTRSTSQHGCKSTEM